MLRPTSLKNAPRYPVTSAVAAGAIVVSGMWWSGQDISASLMNREVWADWQLWRALTCTLPHVNFFHLAFNLYWLWTFGTLVEQVYGHLKCVGIFLLLAFGSSLPEFALWHGAVGLSGVVYGLWGMLWVLERRDARFASAVDRQTNQLFIGWFFLCIALTISHVMQVANIAHGVGAVMGLLLGHALAGKRAVKWESAAGLAMVVILGLAGSTLFWPWVNLSKTAESRVEQAGLDALNRSDLSRAIKFLEISTHMRNAPARAWYNLGVVYQQAGRFQDAAAAFAHAAQMPDADGDMQRAAAETNGHSATNKIESNGNR
jgi:membrane associated rhomboid family serine protease